MCACVYIQAGGAVCVHVCTYKQGTQCVCVYIQAGGAVLANLCFPLLFSNHIFHNVVKAVSRSTNTLICRMLEVVEFFHEVILANSTHGSLDVIQIVSL